MTPKKKIILFKARTKMLNVSYNYELKIKCRLCHLGEDDQEHLLECLIIKIECPEILHNTNVKHSDIYSSKIDKQIEITKLLEMAIRKRDRIK